MMAQFMMDLKTEPRLSSPSLYSPASPKTTDSNGRPQSTDSGVLDLSKRRDSLDARKTPSPSSYHCFGDAGGTPPPSHHSSPQCEAGGQSAESAILLNYSELVRARRLSPTKSLLHFDALAHQPPHLPHGRETVPLLPFNHHSPHHHGMIPPKPETDILQQRLLQQVQRTAAIPSYLLQPVAALQQQQQQQQQQHHHHLPQPQPAPTALFSPGPARQHELDTLSESGSEGKSHVTSSGGKPKDDGSGPGHYPMVMGRDGKLARPFKAYPRDPLSLAAGFVASDTILDTNSAEKYNLFRKRMLEQIHAANGGQPTVSNPKMRRLASSGKSAASILSDASSESCDEKPPSTAAEEQPQQPQHQQATPTMAAARSKKQSNAATSSGSSEMAQRAANQRRAIAPSLPCDSDSSHQSDCDSSKRSITDPRPSCEEGSVPASDDVTRTEGQSLLTEASSTGNGGGGSGGSGSVKDSAYYERRKKNNAAAKKSRDRRRIKEDEIAIRAAFLERENIELKFELAAARKQLALYGVTASVAS